MKEEKPHILNIIENLSEKSYYDMIKEESEWHDVCIYIVPFIAQKYKYFPDIRHNIDAKNSKDYKLPDFEFITKWIEEIPAWFYEHTRICGKWDHNSQRFLSPSKQELIQQINIDYEKKNMKKYISLTWLKWLIFSGVIVSSNFQPLDILQNFRAQEGNFEILIFVWFTNKNNTFLLIYQKEVDVGYEIHLESLPERFLIHKDTKIDFLTNTFNDRILKNKQPSLLILNFS